MPHFCNKPRSSLDKHLLIQQNKAQRIFRQLLFRLIYQQIALPQSKGIRSQSPLLAFHMRAVLSLDPESYGRNLEVSQSPLQTFQMRMVLSRRLGHRAVIESSRPLKNLLVITTAGVPDAYSLVIRSADEKKAVPSSHDT